MTFVFLEIYCVCVCVCVCGCGQVNTAHELQFASFNSLEEVVEKEEKMTEHVRVVLAREKELSETVSRLKQVRCCMHGSRRDRLCLSVDVELRE